MKNCTLIKCGDYLSEKAALNERPKAIIFLAATAVMWSLGGLLIKSINAHPLAIAGVRSGISAVIMLITAGRPKFNWSLAQIGAALSYVGMVTLFVAATKNTTAANAILIQYTAPVYVIFLSAWLLKEKVNLFDWVTVIIVMAGMAMFFIDDISMGGMLGNVLAAGSGISFAVFTVFMRMQKEGSPLESVILGNLLTALIGLPFLFTNLLDTRGWLYLTVLGTLQLGIPYILYSKAIKHVTALEASLIPVIEPILNPVWVYIFLGEAPGSWALAGGIIVIAAVTVRCVIPLRRHASHIDPAE